MSELFVSRLRDSEKLTASAAVSVSTGRSYGSIFRIISNRNIHVAIGSTATVQNMFLPAGTGMFVGLAPTETLAFITATGEVAGDIWVTSLDKQ